MQAAPLKPVSAFADDLPDTSVTCVAGRDEAWHEAIVDACPSIRGGYSPPLWARNGHVQNLLTILRSDYAEPAAWEHDERLVMEDGGTVSVQWLGLELPPETPVLVVLHTICGSADASRRTILALQRELGWVVAACNRRGHFFNDTATTEIYTMGSTDDFRAQLAAIEKRRPDAALYGLGISAGSGLLVRYLGEARENSRLKAGVALCPAYDLRDAFLYAHRAYDAYLTRKMIDFFLRRNEVVLSAVDGFAACAESTSIAEFHDRIHPLAGFSERETYYEETNPMVVAGDIDVPILVINSADDPVCVERNVHVHLERMRQLDRMTLAFTQRGGHCAFFEGPTARECWTDRTIAEYFTAAHRLLDDEV
jgi:predicted alpha/beta-fold hydrolase